MTDAVDPPETAPSPVGGVIAFAAVAVVALAVGAVFEITVSVAATVLGGIAFWLAIRWHEGDGRLDDRVTDWSRSRKDGLVTDRPPESGVPTPASSTESGGPAPASSTESGGPAPASSTESDLRDRRAETVLATESVVGLTFGVALGLLICPTIYLAMYVGGTAVAVQGLLTVAITTVVLGGTTGSPGDTDDHSPTVQSLFGGTFDTLAGTATVGFLTLCAFGLLALAAGAVAVWILNGVPGTSPGYSGPTDLQLLFTAQILGLAVTVAVPQATATVERILGGSERDPPSVVNRLETVPSAIPNWYWGLLLVQLLLVLLGVEVPIFSAITSVSGVLGGIVTITLGRLVPLASVAVLTLSTGVVFCGLLHEFVVESSSAGPVVLRLMAAHLPLTVGVALLLAPLSLSGVVWLSGTAVGVVLATITASAGLYSLTALVRRRPLFDHAEWYGYASLLTLSLALIGYTHSSSPLLLYVGVALGLLVWYVGEAAAEFGEQLGRSADTGTGEATHAVALGGTLTVAVGLVSLVTYVVGVPSGRLGTVRTAAAVVFLSVAALAVIAREAGFESSDRP